MPTQTQALQDSRSTRLGAAIGARLAEQPGLNGFRPLLKGVDALLARILLAEAAERSLDLQYYIWHSDLTGRFLTEALLRAADRGVHVRALLDDIGAQADDERLLTLTAHPNIEIRLFNPVSSRRFRKLSMLSDFSRTNRRMHNKAFIADNQAAIVGGRNIGDEYFEASSEVAFGDLDVLAFGPVVPEISQVFEQFWNSTAAVPITTLLKREASADELAELRSALSAFIAEQQDSPYVQRSQNAVLQALSDEHAHFFRGQAQILYDAPSKIQSSPEDDRAHLLPQLTRTGIVVDKQLLVVSPYFIPGKAGVEYFRKQVARGVEVRILTNSLAANDVGAVHSGYQRYRLALLEAGVKLYELKPNATTLAGPAPARKWLGSSRASLHAKTFVFDQKSIFVGSLNLDPRSIRLNTEIGLICDAPDMARLIATGLEENLDHIAWRLERQIDSTGHAKIIWIEHGPSGTHRLTQEPEVSALRRFAVWLIGLLPLESQL